MKVIEMKMLILSLLVAVAMILSSCGKSSSPHTGHADSAMAQTGDYYTCTMHPQVHLDKPGVCPICGMELVKASNSRRMEGVGAASMVPLNDRDQLLANVSTVKVGYEDVEQSVRAFGTLEIAEPNKTVISARFNGRIEKLHVDAVGIKVKQGDPLFEIYSPDIIQAENEYLQAFKTGSSAQHSTVSDPKSKLLLLGLTQQQIHELESANAVPLVITYYSPANGIVIDKKVVTGVYVSEGSTLYEISDISTLWNIAEVYESDAGYIRIGEKANLSIASYPDEMFTGTVSLIYPVVNPQTRTVKVRVLLNNANGKLKPNMYTETLFTRKKGKSLTVPVSAVLVTGKRNLVYVKTEHENHFEAREVGLGSRFNDKYEITWGLTEGEVVVSEGGYLIDSESQLKSGTGSTHQHGGTGTPETKTKEMPANMPM
jgi:Cu(I)/Ag(I) efflux system membrane fusion protein